MRAVLLLILWPALVSAQDVTQSAWGVPVAGSTPSAVSLEPCDLPCLAVVEFDNTLVTTGQGSRVGGPAVVRTTLTSTGLTVDVTVETGIGLAPDLMQVRPPPGYAAQPSEMPVDDGASGRVWVGLAPTS
ncbi:hypothetical protein [Rubellimicrobium aerolatum]|uniref:Uncharacterized protein n=1 Tax=Rubellimicrobium aerolatum TaxID=490979 RepID=A0ABW0SAM7_9RHOB|nr:hypothetical protein [Rubellimicrobium aerolatum]MBP1805313.1 hypothetical protein [Rubellimicrobium aerolatum]